MKGEVFKKGTVVLYNSKYRPDLYLYSICSGDARNGIHIYVAGAPRETYLNPDSYDTYTEAFCEEI